MAIVWPRSSLGESVTIQVGESKVDQWSQSLLAATRPPTIAILALMQLTYLMSCSGPEISQAPLKSTMGGSLETSEESTKSGGGQTSEVKQGNGDENEAAVSAFDGTWIGSCFLDDRSGQYLKLKVVITGSSFVKTRTYFYNATCAQTTVGLEVTSNNSFTLGSPLTSPSGAVAVNRTASTFTAKPFLLMFLGFLNETPVCGGGFVLNEAKSVTKSECVGDSFIGDQFDPIFDIVGISETDGKLYFGALDGDNNGRTIDLRPQSFDSYGYVKQPSGDGG